jgi:hypothetical protein
VRVARLVGPLGAVIVATVAALALTRAPGPAADEPVAASGPAPIEVGSDGPRFASLTELAAASDVVVRAEVRATERGRRFGTPGGTAIESRLVTIVVSDVLRGEAAPGQALLVEEEGWLGDGTPLVVDGTPPSARGDDAVWFLADLSDADGPHTVVGNAQGRYLVDGGRLEGAALDDALIASIEGLGLEGLTGRVAALPR